MGSDGGAWAMDPAVAWKTYFAPQGIGADLIATKYGFSRDDVDAYAMESQKRAAKAWAEGRFKNSVIGVRDVIGEVVLDHDEHMRPQTDMQSLGSLAPAFQAMGEQMPGFDAIALMRYPEVERIDHVHHAGNSSGIVDGASGVLVGSKEMGEKYGLKPRARIRAMACIGSEPMIMLTGPEFVANKVLQRAGMTRDDIDLFELNEAFASVVLRFMQALEHSARQDQRQRRRHRHGPPARRHRRHDPRHGARRAGAHRQGHGADQPVRRRRHGHRHDHRARLNCSRILDAGSGMTGLPNGLAPSQASAPGPRAVTTRRDSKGDPK